TLLALLPKEVIEKDYGCGDPSRYVQAGDVVLDLGSGSGKICYMAAQLVGDSGRVIGVDMNDDMLALARKYQAEMAQKLGGDKVSFVKGQIQDLKTNLDQQNNEQPMIADNSVDLVLSNCVLNLVNDSDKKQLVEEIFRVVKPGGRIAISDIVADEVIPAHLKADPELWSGCISGSFLEDEFLESFKQAGFLAVKYDKWDAKPWKVVEGIEFRSVTLTAVKGQSVACIDKGHAVIYKGPYAEISDDEGHVYYRGKRMAVCERSYNFIINSPYADDFIGISPAKLSEGQAWCAPSGTLRPASETKGSQHSQVNSGGSCC
ncbi:MAG: methyltransferase domain-containing protein, partial [Cycloclasticus sp.]|nr:methyltransferase domain-containing protein [Cycloclasticus sp.]MBQ0790289.1 methyltransferase domain-containing protein [Cycloclasticus sp.]